MVFTDGMSQSRIPSSILKILSRITPCIHNEVRSAHIRIAVNVSKQIMNMWRKFLLGNGMSCCATGTLKRMFIIHTHQCSSGSIRLPGASDIGRRRSVGGCRQNRADRPKRITNLRNEVLYTCLIQICNHYRSCLSVRSRQNRRREDT
nr:MAG TPA: hypothetical protein [Caudoviricetes sp.]